MHITSEMVEAAAKAFWEAPSLYGDERCPWEHLPYLEKKAAIGPMRDDMISAARFALEAALRAAGQ